MHRTTQLECQITRQYGERQGVRGGAHAVYLVDVDPADGPWGFIQVGRVDQDEEIGCEVAQLGGAVLWGVTGLQHEDRSGPWEKAGIRQPLCDQNPGCVIRPQGVADSQDGDPGLSILPGLPLLQ